MVAVLVAKSRALSSSREWGAGRGQSTAGAASSECSLQDSVQLVLSSQLPFQPCPALSRELVGRWQSRTPWTTRFGLASPPHTHTETDTRRSIQYDEGNRKGVRTRYAPILHSSPALSLVPALPIVITRPIILRLPPTHARRLGAVEQRILCFVKAMTTRARSAHSRPEDRAIPPASASQPNATTASTTPK